MPRSPEDLTRAIDAASELFRVRGYDAASIEEVVQATGLNRYALYQAFGGKRELFLAAIDRFHALMMADLSARIAATRGPVLDALRDHFAAPLADMVHTNDSAGSLICQACFAVAPHDPELRKHLEGLLAEKREAMARALAQDAAAGRLRPGVTPASAAAVLITMMFGLSAQAHSGVGADTLPAALDAVFDALRAPPAPAQAARA